MDSLVTAAVANRDCDELNFLHASYGQRTQARELASFQAMSEHYKPRRSEVLNWDWFERIGGSALTDQAMEVPVHGHSQGIPMTYVPFRNANLLCAAVAWAEVIKASYIYIGAVEEDSSGYPDCREVFFRAFQETITAGTRNDWEIRLATPVLHLRKTEIVKLGRELKAPFELSWSCYVGNETACGECDSCRLRRKAFELAGVEDPIPYRNKR